MRPRKNDGHRQMKMVRWASMRPPRDGAILLIVLVMVTAISVAVYSFSTLMLTELSVTQANNQLIQQNLLADSAIESLLVSERRTLASLTLPPFAASRSYHGTVTRILLPEQEALGQFAILQQYPSRHREPNWGLANQSAKLNLNALTPDRVTRKQVLKKLTCYRGLTESMASGIAEMLGFPENQDSSQSWDGSSSSAPAPRIESMDQLLALPGITPHLLFGEDRNANGRLDPWEDDGDLSAPSDNANGILDLGWSSDWTLTAGESNYTPEGQPKINLNQDDLVDLYDQLIQFATPDQARFVVACRLTSPTYIDDLEDSYGPTVESIEQQRIQSVADRLRAQLGDATPAIAGNESLSEALVNSATTESFPTATTRAGIDLSRKTSRRLNSLLDLASCQLQLFVDGEDTVLVSPFANDPESLQQWLSLWESKTTVREGIWHAGRINILQASESTLTTITGVSAQMAKRIIAERTKISQSGPNGSTPDVSIAWLLRVGLVSTAQLRSMASEITTGGDLHHGIVIGQLDNSRTASATEIQLDARGPRLRLLSRQVLEPLESDLRLPIPR